VDAHPRAAVELQEQLLADRSSRGHGATVDDLGPSGEAPLGRGRSDSVPYEAAPELLGDAVDGMALGHGGYTTS
jgi:hypothetical protein